MQPNQPLSIETLYTCTVLITSVVTLIGMATSNCKSIAPNNFAAGDRAQVVYTAPSSGRVSTNLYNEDGDIMLHIDYRVDYRKDTNTIVLNSRRAGDWGKAERISPIMTTPGTVVTLVIHAGQNDYTITFTRKEVATYSYRFDKPVTKIECDTYSYGSVVQKLAVLY